MKTPNLIASATAVLITFASLSMVNYNIDSQVASTASSNTIEVTNLPAVEVRPSAAEWRAAALLDDIGTAGIATIPTMIRMDDAGKTGGFNLLGSELAMPYYSFSNKFGRITKE